MRSNACLALLVALALPTVAGAGTLHDPREVRLAEVRQLTFAGENAEAYWSPDGRSLVYQATVPPYGCDQIFRRDLDAEAPELVSTGDGRTTCAYFTYPDGERILYSSTHHADVACPPPPDRSRGYVWPVDGRFEIYSVAADDGADLRRLTDNDAYDAEATVCPLDGSIVFTSTRDGDLDLYRMDADGANVVRLTDTPGYDGGAFFSDDCSRLVWRASRPAAGAELEDYRALLDQGLVRPGRLEIWVAEADGSEARQITYLGAASFAPSFTPDGRRVLFSSNVGDPGGREFDLWAIDVDGTDLERITFTAGFDGFPKLSPDGRWLAFASNRNQGQPGETDVYVARWREAVTPSTAPAEPVAETHAAADRWMAAVEWLAHDAREGRGIGTAGLDDAAVWLAGRFAELGLEPGATDGSFLQAFDVPVEVEVLDTTRLAVAGDEVAAEAWTPAAFSASGAAGGEVVDVGYGISAPELHHDDYHGRDVEGKVVLVRRFVPAGFGAGDGGDDNGGDDNGPSDAERRYGDLRHKAYTAREHGAAAVLVVDRPEVADGEALPEEAPLPSLAVDAKGDAGLPVAFLTRGAAAPLLGGGGAADLRIDLEVTTRPAYNVVGRLPGAGDGDGRPVLVGAHYDHLGFGHRGGSLDPDSGLVHNGADDNASGTAALLEIARRAGERRGDLDGDLWIVAFAGEESGLLGSTAFTRHLPAGLTVEDLQAMINLDMVGRLRRNRLSAMGAGSAEELGSLVTAACAGQGVECVLGGDGYGPSDQTPFYAAGVPVVHFFTGAHEQYHRPSDDPEHLNAAGAARIAHLVADLALDLAGRPEPLTYVATAAPEPRGDQRSYGASLGTIPDYAGDGRAGVLLAGAREGSAAERAGLRRGDLLVALAGTEVGDIYDFMYVLRESKPGETVDAVVVRDGERLTLPVTFDASRGLR